MRGAADGVGALTALKTVRRRGRSAPRSETAELALAAEAAVPDKALGAVAEKALGALAAERALTAFTPAKSAEAAVAEKMLGALAALAAARLRERVPARLAKSAEAAVAEAAVAEKELGALAALARRRVARPLTAGAAEGALKEL